MRFAEAMAVVRAPERLDAARKRVGRRTGRAGPLLVLALSLLALSLLAGSGHAATHATPPARIVSINLCTDQIVLDLVPRERIAAVSHLAADPAVSAGVGKAAGIPTTRGEAETVLRFDPDLVLAGEWSTPATVSLLERIGRRVVKVPLAGDLDGVRAAIRQVAAAVEDIAAGERLVADLDRRLGAIRAPDRSGPPHEVRSALVYQVNGLASGAGSLADALMTAAGLANHARRLGSGAGGTLALERLVADPPDLLVLTGPVDEYRTALADNLRHPALVALRAERASVIVPWRYWLCGTQHAATAVHLLAEARAGLRAPAGQPTR